MKSNRKKKPVGTVTDDDWLGHNDKNYDKKHNDLKQKKKKTKKQKNKSL